MLILVKLLCKQKMGDSNMKANVPNYRGQFLFFLFGLLFYNGNIKAGSHNTFGILLPFFFSCCFSDPWLFV